MTSWTFGRKLGVGVAVVAFAVVAITGLRTTQALAADAELVAHTHPVRAQLLRLLAELSEAETSERGYATTGADRSLEPCRTAPGDLDSTCQELHQLTGDTAMLDDVRSAVTATVTGSKAVDAGATLVADVARTFRQITAMVTTTVEATREIELSTKQQASAVEQVHAAIGGLAQTTRETEAGATQTLQTSSQRTSLSTSLTRLVQARS